MSRKCFGLVVPRPNGMLERSRSDQVFSMRCDMVCAVRAYNSTLTKPLERAAEQVARVALDFGVGHRPAAVGEIGVLIREHAGEDAAGMAPLVNDLIHDARIGVLRREAQADEFQAHS